MKRRLLQFEIKIKPLSPVHIGIGGEKLPRKTYHLYDGKWNKKTQEQDVYLAYVSFKKLARFIYASKGDSKAIQILDELAITGEYKKYDWLAEAIESNPSIVTRCMRVNGGAKQIVQSQKGFKPLIALASGLPYIPGSSVKGALRTVWLDWQIQDGDGYERFSSLAKAGRGAGLTEQKQTAEEIVGVNQEAKMTTQNLDLFRAVSVSDLLPFADSNNTELLEVFHKKRLSQVYAVVPLSYEADQNRAGYERDGGKIRRANNNRAEEEAWECLDPAVGVYYKGTITIDIDLLGSMLSKDEDVKKLGRALQNIDIWRQALEKYSERFTQFEIDHYNMISGLNRGKQGDIRVKSTKSDDKPKTYIVDWLSEKSKQKLIVFPLGMGVGLMAHSVLGVRFPDSGEKKRYLGHEPSGRGGTTMLGQILTRSRYQDPDYPTPKSRRVVGDFSANELNHRKVSRPLGWTSITLTHKE